MEKRSKSIVAPADEGVGAAKLEGAVRDEDNPRLIFQTAHTSILRKALRGETGLLALARREMGSRGLDENGAWVGLGK